MNTVLQNLKPWWKKGLPAFLLLALVGCAGVNETPLRAQENDPAPVFLSLKPDTSAAIFTWTALRILEAPELDFALPFDRAYTFHGTIFRIDSARILWVNELPVLRLSPMKKIYCPAGSYLENTGPEPGMDFKKVFDEDGAVKSVFTLRLEEVRSDTCFLKFSWVQLWQ